MRLWHEALIPYLPRQQLLGQHRECCALRGKGWGKKHATVNYVFEHPYGWLVAYHKIVMQEMEKRGYSPNQDWYSTSYRGKSCEELDKFNSVIQRNECIQVTAKHINFSDFKIYPEHDEAYLKECLDNLEAKGIHISQDCIKL